MNTNTSLLQISDIEVLVLRKSVKNLHLNVLPPIGKVRVTAPFYMKDDAIQTFLATRLSWIRKQQARFKSQERQTPREYVSGETHYFLGNKYKLEVIRDDVKPKVEIAGKKKIVLTVRPDNSLSKREQVMLNWYREELRTLLYKAIGKWEDIIGVKVNNWGIKRMKTRWGTCNNKLRTIWLNLELAKKPVSCVEYVVVHELVHLIEQKHNDKFIALMDNYLPKWRSERDELNRFILSFEEWNQQT